MKVRVHDGGFQTTVQDSGRKGWQRYGVVVGGAMDTVAFQTANLLVGNPPQEAVLEMALRGVELSFERDALVALCGADFHFTVDGAACPQWRPVFVRPGSTLKVGYAVKGLRGYLSIAGHWDIPLTMGSKSTYVYGGFGGIAGRALQSGDTFDVFGPACSEQNGVGQTCLRQLREQAGAKAATWPQWSAGPAIRTARSAVPRIRVLTGPDFSRLDRVAQHDLFTERFTVTPVSNRMGIRLEGKPLSVQFDRESVSKPMTFGTLQRTHDGQLTVLMADGETTGGYPAVGVVASVDLPLLAQARPGSSVSFQPLSLRQAVALRNRQLAAQRTLETAVKLRIASPHD